MILTKKAILFSAMVKVSIKSDLSD